LALGCEPGGIHRCLKGEGEDEIVELAVIAICPNTKREVGRFHRFIRPSFWIQNEEALYLRFPADCFNTNVAAPFADVLADFLDWLPIVLAKEIDDLTPEDFLFVCWRDQELETFLPKQCNTPEPGAVAEELQNIFFSRWVCLRDVFIDLYSMTLDAAPQNSALMMKHL